MPKNAISYVEIPTKQLAEDQEFYNSLFGWSFKALGSSYASVHQAGLAGGLNGGEEGRTAAPLLVVETDDIEGIEDRIVKAGGKVTLPIFAYPGGRRLHFLDLSGNEIGVMQAH